MNTLLRNFFTTLRRFRLATTLNILGLSLAFVSLIAILIQTKYDLSFDSHHPKADRIYRIEVSADGSKYNALVGRKWAELIKEKFPQVEYTGLRMKFSLIGDYLKVERDGTVSGFNETVQLVHPDFAEVFDFDMVQGSRDVLHQPGQILLPLSMAKRFYGNENIVGKKIVFTRDSDTTMVVGGVYRDFPANTSVDNAVYYGINPEFWGGWDGWQFNYELFITTTHAVDPAHLGSMLLESVRQSSDVPEWVRNYQNVRLTPLRNIYYASDIEFDSCPKGSATKTWLLVAVSILIIFIASFNFVNFSVSLVPLRINSINIRKVLGSSNSVLRTSLLFESVGVCFLAYLLALFAASQLQNTRLNDYMTGNISIVNHLDIVFLSLVIALSVGAVAGIYPALYSTRFSPAIVLKGSFGLSPRGRMLRTSLIAMQYIISMVLIIGAAMMQLQNHYFRSFDPGYHTSQVLTARLNDNVTVTNRQNFMNELKKSSQIHEVAYSQFLFGTGDAQQHRFAQNGKEFNFAFIPVSADFFKVMDIPIVEGRSLTEGDEKGERMTTVVNRSFLRVGEVQVGSLINEGTVIVGAIDDICFRPLRTTSSEPLCFYLPNENWRIFMPYTYFRIEGDPFTAIDHIKRSVAAIDPAMPVDVRFYDQVFDSVYRNEQRISTLITLFSLLAIAISLVGILGLIFFETQYRRKEIGLRKVYGSTVSEVIRMINKKYLSIVVGCFVVATPIAWWGVNEWLKSFAYRTPIHWWVFALTLGIVAFVTALIVSLQSWQTAVENPTKSLNQ